MNAQDITLIEADDQQDLFSYASLTREQEASARSAAADIKTRLRRSAEDIVVIGQRLIEQKGSLPHGAFLRWIKAEFGMSDKSAERFMSVAGKFSGKIDTMSNLNPTALYALAAPSTPDAVRSAAEELVVEGEKVRAEDVKRMKRTLADLERQQDNISSLRETVDRLKAEVRRDADERNRERMAEKERARREAEQSVQDRVAYLEAENARLGKAAEANLSKSVTETVAGRDKATFQLSMSLRGELRRHQEHLAFIDLSAAAAALTDEEKSEARDVLEAIADLHSNLRRKL